MNRPTMQRAGRYFTQVFFLTDLYCWRLILDGVVVEAEWKSKGAAIAAIPVERARRARIASFKHAELHGRGNVEPQANAPAAGA